MQDSFEEREALVVELARDLGYLIVKLQPRPDAPDDETYALVDIEWERPGLVDVRFGRLDTLSDVRDALEMEQ